MIERLTGTYPCDSCNTEVCYRRCYALTLWAEKAKEKLAEYENAEEEGRMVILPKCNIGDTVYIPIDFQNKIYAGTIEGFEYAKMRNKWVVKIRTDDEGICYEAFEDFGKTIFLIREEAEKALKEIRDEGND